MKINNYTEENLRSGLLNHWLTRIAEIGSLQSSNKGYAFLSPFLVASRVQSNNHTVLNLPFAESVMTEVNEKKYTSEFEDYILEELIIYTNYDAVDLRQTTFNVISTSILTSRNTINKKGKNTKISVKGRHDPCVGIRAVPIGEAMMSCVILDHYLLNKAQCG